MPKAPSQPTTKARKPGKSNLERKALRQTSSNEPQGSTFREALKTSNPSPLARKPAPEIEQTDESILFQVIDVQGYTNPSRKMAEIHIFGVTEIGNSILLRIPSFKHYFYVPQPEGFTEEDLEPLKCYLNLMLKGPCIKQITLDECTFAANRKVTPKSWPTGAFLKISVKDYRDIQRASQIFKAGHCLYNDLFVDPTVKQTYGSSIPYNLRFTLDYKIEAMSWIRLEEEEYNHPPESNKVSHCQLEVWARPAQLIVCDPAVYEKKRAPLRILSFDIETLVPADKSLPIPTREQVIQIGNMVSIYDGDVLKPSFVKKIFTLDTCDPIDGAQISSFDDEKEMLTAWREFFMSVDADVIIGYNHAAFDIPFVLKRAEVLGIKDFACMGRIRGIPQVLSRDEPSYSSCPGYNGRILLDLRYHLMGRFSDRRKSLKLESFKLKDVAPCFLNEQKEDIHFMQIPVLQAGNSATRKELAVYCLKDVELPLKLLDKQKCLEHDVNLARQSGMSLHDMRVLTSHRKMFAVRWKEHQCILLD